MRETAKVSLKTLGKESRGGQSYALGSSPDLILEVKGHSVFG